MRKVVPKHPQCNPIGTLLYDHTKAGPIGTGGKHKEKGQIIPDPA